MGCVATRHNPLARPLVYRYTGLLLFETSRAQETRKWKLRKYNQNRISNS